MEKMNFPFTNLWFAAISKSIPVDPFGKILELTSYRGQGFMTSLAQEKNGGQIAYRDNFIKDFSQKKGKINGKLHGKREFSTPGTPYSLGCVTSSRDVCFRSIIARLSGLQSGPKKGKHEIISHFGH